MTKHFFFLFIITSLLSCQKESISADLIIINANIWTGNLDVINPDAMAIKGDLILATGSMKDIEKYVWLLIVLAIVSAVFPLFRDIYLASIYGANDVPISVKGNWQSLSILFVGLPKLGAALWLNYIAKKHGASPVLWAGFGLFFGIMAIGLYYLVRIDDRKETRYSAQSKIPD